MKLWTHRNWGGKYRIDIHSRYITVYVIEFGSIPNYPSQERLWREIENFPLEDLDHFQILDTTSPLTPVEVP